MTMTIRNEMAVQQLHLPLPQLLPLLHHEGRLLSLTRTQRLPRLHRVGSLAAPVSAAAAVVVLALSVLVLVLVLASFSGRAIASSMTSKRRCRAWRRVTARGGHRLLYQAHGGAVSTTRETKATAEAEVEAEAEVLLTPSAMKTQPGGVTACTSVIIKLRTVVIRWLMV